MRSIRLLVISFAVCVFVTSGLTAQQMSEKKDLAIFKLNYYGAPVYQPSKSVTISATIGKNSVSVSLQSSGKPEVDQLFQQTVGQVDQTISQVFFDLGRFNILAMPQRLTSEDLPAFVDAIKDFKEKNLVIPDAVSLGQQIFTEADFNRLVGSFVIVVPTVTFYDLTYTNQYEATITTNFSIIDVSTNRLIGQFKIDTTGYDDKSDAKAMRAAVEAIPGQLTYEVRKVPAFQISTGITEIVGGDVVLEFGKNMGLQLGDEYNIFRSENIGTYSSEKATGLLIIKDVREQFSIAQVVYADPAPVIGDQLREAPRIGVDVTPYVNVLLGLTSKGISDSGIGGFIGARAALSRGFYGLRPIAGLDLALGDAFPVYVGFLGTFLPVSLYLGGEYNIYLGRLKLVPEIGLGAVGYVNLDTTASSSERFLPTHIRAHAKANITFLVADNIEVGLQAGFIYGFPLSTNVSALAGAEFGAGVTIK